MQGEVVAAREENIHEANSRRERQNFVGPRHRIVQCAWKQRSCWRIHSNKFSFWMESLKDSRKVKYGYVCTWWGGGMSF